MSWQARIPNIFSMQHGYRYFVGTAASDASSNSSFTTPGYASTYGHGSAVGYGNYATGNFSSNTIITPPQTYNIHKPALTVAIKMSNDEKSLEPYGMVISGVKVRPRDAAFLIQSLPKSWRFCEGTTLMILGILVLVFILFLFWLFRPTFLLLYGLHRIKRSIGEQLKALDDDSAPRFFSIYAPGTEKEIFQYDSETETLIDIKTGESSRLPRKAVFPRGRA
jgi:hypothetical protein